MGAEGSAEKRAAGLKKDAMRTPQWIKKLGGHAGELYVCAELSKRGIPNALLPENFSDDDILIGNKDGTEFGFIQVKSCHPDRSASFILRQTEERWIGSRDNEFCILVWLGKTAENESPQYWIAAKREFGELCVHHGAHGTSNWERRFYPGDLPKTWKDRWKIFDKYQPEVKDLVS